MIYALCRMLLRDRQEAEDAAQQAFLQAHRSLLQGVVPENATAWLATIARNECYRRLGRAAPPTVPLREEEESQADTAAIVDQRAEIEIICQALTELPPRQRQAVVLREFYGLSYQEVAAVLGVSGPAVESLLFKGRRSLQDRLRPLRAASPALVFPAALEEALGALIPGFAGAASSASGAVVAKLAMPPLAAKVSAAVIAVGASTAVVGDQASRPEPPATREDPNASVFAERQESGVGHRKGSRTYVVLPRQPSRHPDGQGLEQERDREGERDDSDDSDEDELEIRGERREEADGRAEPDEPEDESEGERTEDDDEQREPDGDD